MCGHSSVPVSACVLLCVQGMDPTFCERLSDFTLHTDTLCVRPVIDMPWQYQTPALLNTITQLCGGLCAGGGAALVLRGWYWRPDTLLAYVRAIPTLTELGVERHRPRINGSLTDDLLTVAVAVGIETHTRTHTHTHTHTHSPEVHLFHQRMLQYKYTHTHIHAHTHTHGTDRCARTSLCCMH